MRRATGDERWSVVRANPVRDADGHIVLAVSVIHDVTEARAAQERARFLARGSEMLNETLAYEHTIGALADVAVPMFAGHVTVDLYEDGRLRCVGARHLDPEKTDMMLRLREQYPPTVEAHPVQRALDGSLLPPHDRRGAPGSAASGTTLRAMEASSASWSS